VYSLCHTRHGAGLQVPRGLASRLSKARVSRTSANRTDGVSCRRHRPTGPAVPLLLCFLVALRELSGPHVFCRHAAPLTSALEGGQGPEYRGGQARHAPAI
jgi:hypothetical protein